MPKRIAKRELRKLLRQGKKREALVRYFKVSKFTVGRYIRKYGLVGIAKRGRKPFPKKPEKIKPRRLPRIWAPMKDYIHTLNEEYHFVNISYPPYRFFNQKSLVCSNQPRNPSGSFTTVGIYFIVFVSNVYFLYTTSIRYSQDPKPLKEVYEWIAGNVGAILEEKYSQYYIVKPIAYTFSRANRKPKAIKYG